MTAVTVHVIDNNVVPAGDGNAVVLVDDNAIADFRVICGRQIKAYSERHVSHELAVTIKGC